MNEVETFHLELERLTATLQLHQRKPFQFKQQYSNFGNQVIVFFCLFDFLHKVSYEVLYSDETKKNSSETKQKSTNIGSD